MAFSFGKPFGTATTTAASTGGLFGTTAATTSASAFGYGGFGTGGTPSSASTFGGFGSTNTTTPSGFGTGFGFGTGTSTAPGASTGFGTGFGTSTGTGTGFGTSTGTGTAFGTSTGTGTGFGGFGTGSTLGAGTTGTLGGTGTGFGTTGTLGGTGTGFGLGGGLGGATGTGVGATHNPQQNAAAQLANMATAVSLPMIFGDERDALIAKWNQLQSFWGTGKGFFNQQGQSVEFKPDNPFCRFKAVGYSCMPSSRNRDGLVCINFKKKEAEIKQNQQQVVDMLQRIMGNKPNMSVCVEAVKALPDNKSEMILFIQERSHTGATRRLPATEVFNFFNQNHVQTQLVQQLSVEKVFPKTGMTAEQLKQYLDTPPAGIHPMIWQQAKLDNPDPDRLIPVPMIGFSELHKRLKHQEHQTRLHQTRQDVIQQDISKLQQNQTDQLAKIDQYKRKCLELSHRVLQVMVRQEVYRKQGYAVQADEEQLRVQLENLQAELNAPMQFKGRLNELMSQMRMQNQLSALRQDATYQMDNSVQLEVKQHLKQQQEGIQHLISIIKTDLDDLQLIEQGLVDSSSVRRP